MGRVAFYVMKLSVNEVLSTKSNPIEIFYFLKILSTPFLATYSDWQPSFTIASLKPRTSLEPAFLDASK